MTRKPITFPRHRFPADIISHAVSLYHVFRVSVSGVELILAEHGEFAADGANNTDISSTTASGSAPGERISTGFFESAINQIVDKRMESDSRIVRAARARSTAISLANACSIGLRSGL
jgi:hypothetical protein